MAGDEEGAEAGLYAVDKWSCRKSKVFFLTHMHADHTKGLSHSWRRGPIYCSPITAALLRLRFPALDIHVLEVSIPTLIQLPSHTFLEVTAIDAHHCPGSVMFIFRGSFGCVVHTGDFRWESGSPKLETMKQCLASAIGGSRVKCVYLDNTFCNPQFSFPTRHAASQQVVDIIANHEGFDILIGVDMLGKEELLIFLANTFYTKIWVWPERMQVMKVLGIANLFTLDTSATKIRAVPRYSISKETVGMLNEIKPTVAIVPSGLNYHQQAWISSSSCPHTPCVESQERKSVLNLKAHRLESHMPVMEKDCDLKQTCKKDIFCIPYSLHSCFSELEEFIKYVKPLSVKGNLSTGNVNVSFLLDKQGSDENRGKYSACKPCLGTNEQYLRTVSKDATFSERQKSFCNKLRAGTGLRKALHRRSQRNWLLLRARSARGTCFCS